MVINIKIGENLFLAQLGKSQSDLFRSACKRPNIWSLGIKLEEPTVRTVLLCNDHEFHELHEIHDIDFDDIDLDDLDVVAEFDEEELMPA